MKHKYIVLRAPRELDPVRAVHPLEGLGPSDVKVQIESLDTREVSGLSRERGVVAMARAMPMRLVMPLAPAVAAGADRPPVAWGVSAVRADESACSGDGIVVAVLDTGIDATHAAFAGMDLQQEDFTGEGLDDTNGHGTHCAGTIFGRDVEGTRIGVARGVRRALIGKVIGSRGGSSESIVSAIQWAADHGAHIISMSLGMDFPGLVKEMVDQEGLPADLATSVALEGYRSNVMLFERMAALLRARQQPVLLVAAAGNESRRNLDASYQIAVSPPAVCDGVVSVAAFGRKEGRGLAIADFSNTGAVLGAPGVDILSARCGGGLSVMSGTSMAAPHVAGVAALWAEQIHLGHVAAGRAGLPIGFSALQTRLVGNASADPLVPDMSPTDGGSGLVQAPVPAKAPAR